MSFDKSPARPYNQAFLLSSLLDGMALLQNIPVLFFFDDFTTTSGQRWLFSSASFRGLLFFIRLAVSLTTYR